MAASTHWDMSPLVPFTVLERSASERSAVPFPSVRDVESGLTAFSFPEGSTHESTRWVIRKDGDNSYGLDPSRMTLDGIPDDERGGRDKFISPSENEVLLNSAPGDFRAVKPPPIVADSRRGTGMGEQDQAPAESILQYQPLRSTFLATVGKRIDEGADEDSILSFSIEGSKVSQWSMTCESGVTIQSALDLAAKAVREQYPSKPLITQTLDRWRDENRKKTNEALVTITEQFFVYLDTPSLQDRSQLYVNQERELTQVIQQLYDCQQATLSAGEKNIFEAIRDVNRPYRNAARLRALVKAVFRHRPVLSEVKLFGSENYEQLLRQLLPRIAAGDVAREQSYQAARVTARRLRPGRANGRAAVSRSIPPASTSSQESN
jgi:hypothetical protein